jgi:hypothetical protein
MLGTSILLDEDRAETLAALTGCPCVLEDYAEIEALVSANAGYPVPPPWRTTSARRGRRRRAAHKGADLLIHEVATARPELMSQAHVQRIIAHHTTAREAGMVFTRTKPKLAAYTHLVFLANDRMAPATIDDLVAETRETYAGPLEAGEDLMAFEIGETVQVHRHDHPAGGLGPARRTRQM